MRANLNPRKLSALRHGRGWAAIAFGPAGLELTTARSEGASVSVLQQSSASAVPPAGTPDAALQWQSAAQSLRQRFDPREHRVVTSVSCEDVLCQILRLPATEPAELKQMLDLQIDNITPLPLEEVVYSFEALSAADGQTRVLVAIARKAKVNERVEALESAGLQPEIVSIDALAMFRALARRNLLAQDDRLNVLVILGSVSADVIVYSQVVPLTVRSLILGADGESVLREELQRTFVAAEAGQPERMPGGVAFLAPGEELKAFAEKVANGLAAQSSFLTNGAVPSAALSLCLQYATGEAAQLNLLPEEWREKRKAKALRRRLIRGGIALGIVYGLALSVFLALLAIKKAQLGRVTRETNSRQAAFISARELQGQLIAMRNQLDTKFSALEVLREITMRMPKDMQLNSFVFKKDQTLSLKGQAPSGAIALDFQSRLQQSDLFSKVSERSDTVGGLTKFDLTCTLKTAAGPGVTRGTMKITKRERGILVITITAIVLGINYFLVVPLVGDWKEMGVQLKTKQRILDGMRATIQQKESWSKEYDALKKGLGQQTEPFKYASDVAKKIQQIATSSGVQVNATRQLTEEDKGVYRVMPVQCTVEATTESLVKFLFALQTGAGFMSVEQLTLAPRPENPSILRCEIQVRALSAKQGGTNS